MKRIDRNNILWAVLYIAIIAVLIWIRPKPIDWTPTYDHEESIPFATQLPYQVLQKQLAPEELGVLDSSIADIDRRLKFPSNLIMIDQFVRLDKLEVDSLLQWVNRGGTALIVSEGLTTSLEDTLGLTTSTKLVSNINNPDSLQTLRRSTELNFQPGIRSDTFTIYLNWSYHYFKTKHDTSVFKDQVQALSYNLQGEPVFIKIKIGNGELYLHSFPVALTNYQYLHAEGRTYINRCLSVLPKQYTYWDDYHKTNSRDVENRSLLRVIGEYPSLNTAWYLLLFTLAVYLFLSGRRRQRIIPKWEPKMNQSLEYAKTLGDLYYKNAAPNSMLMKRIQALRITLHQNYHFRNVQFREDEIPGISRKTGIEQDRIKELWDVIQEIRKDRYMTTRQFMKYNSLFTKIYKDLK